MSTKDKEKLGVPTGPPPLQPLRPGDQLAGAPAINLTNASTEPIEQDVNPKVLSRFEEILQLVQQGKMDAEEADKLLQVDENDSP